MEIQPSAHVLLWEFHVRPGHEGEFEHIYGPRGDWAQFFAQSPYYLGSQLYRDSQHPGRYLTVDAWSSGAAYDEFRREREAAYRALDLACEALTVRETFLGSFQRFDESTAPSASKRSAP
jgi:heme-degrading monooxygenase HmoA